MIVFLSELKLVLVLQLWRQYTSPPSPPPLHSLHAQTENTADLIMQEQ